MDSQRLTDKFSGKDYVILLATHENVDILESTDRGIGIRNRRGRSFDPHVRRTSI